VTMKRQCRKAVILAAGEGSRVRSASSGRPKCLMDLGGRPIIEWILLALAEAGISRVVMVTGYRAPVLKASLGARRHGLGISYVHNRRWRQPNGLSLYAARKAVKAGEPFLALMSDHLLSPGIIRKVANAPTARCVLAVDTEVAGVFDIRDATKVRIVDGRPAAIGKKLRSYNAVDCGIFRFDGRMFRAIEAAFKTGRQSLTDGVRNLIAGDDLDVVSVGGDAYWIDIDTPKAYREALRAMDRFASTFDARRKGL
jgi:1L-myo-inositol 1-phosphate cytidylyltransferase